MLSLLLASRNVPAGYARHLLRQSRVCGFTCDVSAFSITTEGKMFRVTLHLERLTCDECAALLNLARCEMRASSGPLFLFWLDVAAHVRVHMERRTWSVPLAMLRLKPREGYAATPVQV